MSKLAYYGIGSTVLGVVVATAVTATLVKPQDFSQLEAKLDEISHKLDRLVPKGSPPGHGPAEPDPNKRHVVPIDGDPFVGRADAKVTIVKAYDYACPYCERVRATMDQVRAKYGDDVRIVYKQLVVHPRVATTGALAFCAAAKQDKAFEMDDLLWEKGFKARKFDRDGCWEFDSGCPVVTGFARELGLDEARFATDLVACKAHVDKDMEDLHALGVNATPSFFINGRFTGGAQPLESFTRMIDDELKSPR